MKIMKSSWAEKLAENNYCVEKSVINIHANYLKSSVEVVKKIYGIVNISHKKGIFNNKEYLQLQDAIALLSRAQVPMSLLTEKDEIPTGAYKVQVTENGVKITDGEFAGKTIKN